MLNFTANMTDTFEKNYDDSYNDGSFRILFLIPIVLGLFTILSAVRFFTNRK